LIGSRKSGRDLKATARIDPAHRIERREQSRSSVVPRPSGELGDARSAGQRVSESRHVAPSDTPSPSRSPGAPRSPQSTRTPLLAKEPSGSRPPPCDLLDAGRQAGDTADVQFQGRLHVAPLKGGRRIPSLLMEGPIRKRNRTNTRSKHRPFRHCAS
jgi:hypothetical protein